MCRTSQYRLMSRPYSDGTVHLGIAPHHQHDPEPGQPPQRGAAGSAVPPAHEDQAEHAQGRLHREIGVEPNAERRPDIGEGQGDVQQHKGSDQADPAHRRNPAYRRNPSRLPLRPHPPSEAPPHPVKRHPGGAVLAAMRPLRARSGCIRHGQLPIETEWEPSPAERQRRQAPHHRQPVAVGQIRPVEHDAARDVEVQHHQQHHAGRQTHPETRRAAPRPTRAPRTGRAGRRAVRPASPPCRCTSG